MKVALAGLVNALLVLLAQNIISDPFQECLLAF